MLYPWNQDRLKTETVWGAIAKGYWDLRHVLLLSLFFFYWHKNSEHGVIYSKTKAVG